MSLDAYLAPHRAGLEARAENLVDFPQKFVAADDAQPIGQAQLLQMVREQLHTGGKRLRALLTPAMVAAAGGPIEAARDFGACVELVHNGTLVHDDIQDNDRLRRGQPTLWTTHGMPQAINAGDAMLVGPLAALLIAPQIELRHRLELANVLAHALMETVRGQVADVALHGTQRPTRQQIEAVHLGKTGPLLAPVLSVRRSCSICPKVRSFRRRRSVGRWGWRFKFATTFWICSAPKAAAMRVPTCAKAS